jgi:hypothetical protein
MVRFDKNIEGGCMVPTPEEIEDATLIENPQFEEAVEAYQEFKAKIMGEQK